MLAVPLALAFASVAAAPAKESVSPHAFQNLVDRTRGAVVRVVSKPEGTAVLVGVRGELFAPAALVTRDALTVELKGEKLEAKVLKKDAALGVALLSLPAGEYAAATVGSAQRLPKGSFLFALGYDRKGQLSSNTGALDAVKEQKDGTLHLRTDVAGPPGSAVFDARGQLVALVAGARMSTVAIDALKERFAASPASPASEGEKK